MRQPREYSKPQKIHFEKDEKVYVITDVGGFNDIKSSDSGGFSLIEIGKTKQRVWIKISEFEERLN